MTEKRVFPSLSLDRQRVDEASARPARVCIASYEFLGPSRNGGIGTAYFSLASALVATGHEVTVLYLLGDRCENGTIDEWLSYFRERHIGFVPLAVSSMPDVPEAAATSRDAYQWLRQRDFDVIHFPELLGHGYYAELAKHQGLDFPETTICVSTHSPMTWIREINREAPYSPDEIEIDFLEHQSVRLADVVISPSHYLLSWIADRNWELPPRCYVQQNLLSPDMQAFWQEPHEGTGKRRSVDEFVFFGRLEERKGLRVFCDALDRLVQTMPVNFTAAFLGKSTTVAGSDAVTYINDRSRNWPFTVRVLTDLDQTAALRFLRERSGRVAIMPSLEDNLPNTVLECLCARIPFLAGRTGGIPEMIVAEDLSQVTFVPTVHELSERLARALKEGLPLARPAIDPDENRLQWTEWHAALASQRDELRQRRPQTSPAPISPRVSVCLSWRARPEALPKAISALEAQDWPNFEVLLVDETASVVVDARNTGDESQGLADLRQRFDSRGWRIIRQPQPRDALTRDCAVAEATGDYLLFSDERSLMKPTAISTFVGVAAHTRAEILSCFLDLYVDGNGAHDRIELGCHPFLGAAIVPSIFRNYLGDGNIFIRKSAFGHVERYSAGGREDRSWWEFLAKAVLTGMHLEVVPRALASHHLPKDLRPPTQAPSYRDHARCLVPYTEEMPAALKDLPTAAVIMKLHYERQYHRAQLAIANERTKLTDDELLALVKERLADEGQEKILEQLLRITKERLMASGYDRIAALLDSWLEYSDARANMPPKTRDRARQVLQQLMKGHYHRFAHGLGSALRDIRKLSQTK